MICPHNRVKRDGLHRCYIIGSRTPSALLYSIKVGLVEAGHLPYPGTLSIHLPVSGFAEVAPR